MTQSRLLPLFAALAAGTALLAAPGGADAQRKADGKAAQQLICSDFYSHANADWLAAHPPIADSGRQTVLGELRDRARQQQFEMLDDDMQFAQGGIGKLPGVRRSSSSLRRPKVAELEREGEVAADFLETLDDRQWRSETLCAGWTVGHLAAHFVHELRLARQL